MKFCNQVKLDTASPPVSLYPPAPLTVLTPHAPSHRHTHIFLLYKKKAQNYVAMWGNKNMASIYCTTNLLVTHLVLTSSGWLLASNQWENRHETWHMTSYVCHSREQGATDLASPPAFPVAVLYNLFVQGAAFHSKRQLWSNTYLPPFSWNVPLAFCKQFNWESKGYSSQWRPKGLLVGQNAITQGSILPVCQHGNREMCVLVAFNLSLSVVFRVSSSVVHLLNI